MRFFFSILFMVIIACIPATRAGAQAITFTSCSDVQGCIPFGNCTGAPLDITAAGTTTCGNPNLNFSYKVDFGGNGSIEVQDAGATVSQTFPIGTSKITWRATNGCGQAATCTQTITVQDCQPPNMICRNGITQSLDNNCSMTINAQQYILSISDNCTPTNQIQYGLRRAGTGIGFPASDTLQYHTCNQGTNIVEVWSRDANGLTNSCSNYVLVQDNSNQCPCIQNSNIQVKGCARTSKNTKLTNYRVNASVQGTGANGAFSVQKTANNTDSCFTLPVNNLPLSLTGKLTLRLSRIDNLTNGVSAYDLILISRHILNLEPITSFYQTLAADVNRSQTVTTFDIVEIRKTLLGVVDTFPAVPSWQFVRPVPDPSNIIAFADLKDTFQIQYTNLSGDVTAAGFNWIGIKSGDLEQNTTLTGAADDRSGPDLIFTAADQWVEAGSTVEVPVRTTESAYLSAWQMAFRTNPELATLTTIDGIPEDAWSVDENGQIRLIWLDENIGNHRYYTSGSTMATLKIKVIRSGYLSQLLAVDPDLLPGEAITAAVAHRPVLFRYQTTGAPTGPAAQFFAPLPNPSSAQVDFPVLLPENGLVILELYNMAGQRIFQKNYEGTQGYQVFTVEETVFPASGAYCWKMVNGNVMQTGKLIRK